MSSEDPRCNQSTLLFNLKANESKKGKKGNTTKRKPDKLTPTTLKEQKSISTIARENYLLHKTLPQPIQVNKRQSPKLYL